MIIYIPIRWRQNSERQSVLVRIVEPNSTISFSLQAEHRAHHLFPLERISHHCLHIIISKKPGTCARAHAHTHTHTEREKERERAHMNLWLILVLEKGRLRKDKEYLLTQSYEILWAEILCQNNKLLTTYALLRLHTYNNCAPWCFTFCVSLAIEPLGCHLLLENT